MFSKLFLALAATAALVAAAPVPDANDKTVTICEGPALDPTEPYAVSPVTFGECTPVPEGWNDRTTSLKVMGDHVRCTFYAHYECEGESVVVETKHVEETYYGEILHLGVAPYHLDKQISSWKCESV